MSYQAVIFDLDGTIVNTLADLAGAMNSALKKLNLPGHSADDCRKMIGDGFLTFASRALPADKQHLQTKIVELIQADYYDNCLQNSNLYDGIPELLDALAQKAIRMAVITNKDQSRADHMIHHFFGDNTFEHIVGTRNNISPKPDIAATVELMKLMKLGPEDFIFVGDSEVDIRTAKAANIHAIGVTWGFRSGPELIQAKADMIIDSPAEILTLFI